MTRRLLLNLLLASAATFAADLPLPAPGNVTLPLDEYNKLLELAAQPVKKADAPPVPYVLKTARFNLDVSGDAAAGSIVLQGEVLASGMHKVPLVSGMVIVEARQNGSELPVERENGVLNALLSGPAEFNITLKTAIPLSIDVGLATLKFRAPAAGSVLMTLCLPGEKTAVNLSSGLITSKTSREGRTAIEAALVPGQDAGIWWASRLSAATPAQPKPVRYLSDVRSLVSVNDSDVTVAALVDLTVVQGEPSQFVLEPPEGYELTSAAGPDLTATDVERKAITLHVNNASARQHQFLLAFTRAHTAAKAEVPFVTLSDAQRENGEVLVESEGALEMNTAARGGLRRMDLKEASPYLRAMSHASLDAAFRYQKRAAETPALTLDWTRYPDSSVLSAVAQRAVVTTLVTSEGRSLTEVKLTLKNQSQPFLKVDLPAGATILSAEVAGDKVKPVEAADGHRVPLLRPGFRTADSYTVSFVFLHAGTPFGKKGAADLSLPRMDLPIGLLEWEVFLPSQYKVSDFGGDALLARLFPAGQADDELTPMSQFGHPAGIVTDPVGAVVPNATVQIADLVTGVTRIVSTDRNGQFGMSDLPAGTIRATISAPGFQTAVRTFQYDPSRESQLRVPLQVGAVSETVEVSANGLRREEKQQAAQARQNAAPAQPPPPSSNIADLQRRVAGVLPIAVSVPHTGTSYNFVRPLVVGEETRLTFTYRNGK